jgi:hypothetical protein
MRIEHSSVLPDGFPILLSGCKSAPSRLISVVAHDARSYLRTARVVIETIDKMGNTRLFPVELLGSDTTSAFTICEQTLVMYPLRSIVCGYRIDDATEVIELRYLRRHYDA